MPSVTAAYPIGTVFGMWTIIGGEEDGKKRGPCYRCKCSCGAERVQQKARLSSLGSCQICSSRKQRNLPSRTAADGERNKHTPGHVLGHKPDDHLRAMQALIRRAYRKDQWTHEKIKFDGDDHLADALKCADELRERGWMVTNIRHGPKNERDMSRHTVVEYAYPTEPDEQECAA